ncbi:hypothetical protein [Tropicimonas sp. IMCC6043]|uniref:hypothetical protein n=1 Tax=Tropicimonas sp. IMCC6043 TaxID=2510645 RepID=UPI00101D1C9D|nr:hypothetical protein [Tropicimonas sp. IMCC6043]RYH08516.1 hypothetical protein EU800_15835 [Tropicimonas sp. IMCC6043]
MRQRHVLLASLAGLLLAGCVSNTPPGKNGGTEQLRASLTPTLQWAGVSDACIAQLPSSTLAEVKGITSKSARSSMDVLQRRQRIRTAAGKVCTTI